MTALPHFNSSLLLAASIPLLTPSLSSADEDFLPVRHEPARHASTWSNSPFSRTVLPAQAPPPPPDDSIAKGWTLTAIDHFDGEFTIGMRDGKNKFHSLRPDTPSGDGIWVCKIERGKNLSDTVVHITDGTRTGKVIYDQSRALANAKPKAAAPKASPSDPRSSRPVVAPVVRSRSPLAPPR